MSSNLYVVIGSILILIGVVGLLFFRRSRKKSKKKYAFPPMAPRTPEQELSDLGILEIRPKTSSRKENDELEEDRIGSDEVEVEIIEVEDDYEIEQSERVAHDDVFEQADDAVTPPQEEETAISEELHEEMTDVRPEQAEVVQGEAIQAVAVDASARDVDALVLKKENEELIEEATVISEIPPHGGINSDRPGVSRREALFRLLNAIQASVDGYTASLVKQDINDRFTIEAIISQNPQAIDVDSPVLKTALLENKHVADAAVTVVEIGKDGVASDVLSYYKEPVNVQQLAIARVKIPDNSGIYYLMIDALPWQDLDDPWQRLMIGQFATLLGTFMATPQLDERSNERVKPRIRPRREIIEEEITHARSKSRPLALALIYLNRAEEIANLGPKAVVDAERLLESLLESALDDIRIERFGELTFGVFHEEEVSEVEAWALLLQEAVDEDENIYFEQGISIGIALLQDRHKTADDLRADATAALRESFETGACTIIE